MNETWIIILYIGFWILTAIGSIAMIIWAIVSRIKEKKIEKEEIQSLDSLFDNIEEPKKEENKIVEPKEEKAVISGNEVLTSNIMQKRNNEPKKQEKPKEDKPAYEMDEDESDLQKELEAKFDELFGKM